MLQNMLKLMKVFTFGTAIKHSRTCNFHSTSYLGSYFKESPYSSSRKIPDHECVGIFWEVDNKLHKLGTPFDLAIKLKKAAEEFGFVKYKSAYVGHDAYRVVPIEPRERRKDRKTSTKYEPFVCKVCGRRFYYKDRLVNHWSVIHEPEHAKWVKKIESAKGRKRALLVGKYSMKMANFKYGAGEILNLKEGYCLADELKRAGFFVREVSNEPQKDDAALTNHMVDLMDRKKVGCVILVSHDSNYVKLLKKATLKCVRTVVIGDFSQGALKKIADTSFSWDEIIRGKAKSVAVSVAGKWKTADALKQLEWTYDPKTDGKRDYIEFESDVESEESNIEGFLSDKEDAFLQKENAGPWWKLKSDAMKPDHCSG